MSELWEYMEAETGTYIKECVKETDGGKLIRKAELERVPKVFREEVIRSVLCGVCAGEKICGRFMCRISTGLWKNSRGEAYHSLRSQSTSDIRRSIDTEKREDGRTAGEKNGNRV